jgi:NADH-quinone oxidoreductase subunit M
MTMRERVVMVPLVVLIVGMGVYPKPVLDRVAPAVRDLVAHVEEHSNFHEPSVAAGIPAAEQGHP